MYVIHLYVLIYNPKYVNIKKKIYNKYDKKNYIL